MPITPTNISEVAIGNLDRLPLEELEEAAAMFKALAEYCKQEAKARSYRLKARMSEARRHQRKADTIYDDTLGDYGVGW